ncbi:hypothetical protein D9619_010564 [Psilocybe cf. subviscida]|uniref:Uncharacterized protein n=1 Tax=Psilocybe cf. subviscida TaxID=2480587 RepID=A0A8H5ERM7_9AGAR|nr:hypothetical protein D9619_010564 [Psilocybe cf. subviscida]
MSFPRLAQSEQTRTIPERNSDLPLAISQSCTDNFAALHHGQLALHLVHLLGHDMQRANSHGRRAGIGCACPVTNGSQSSVRPLRPIHRMDDGVGVDEQAHPMSMNSDSHRFLVLPTPRAPIIEQRKVTSEHKQE